MKLSGDHLFDAPQQAVWDILMDPHAIAQAIPGVDELLPLEGETQAWGANAKISIASVSGRYAGVVRMTEIEAPNQYRLTISGEGQQSIINGAALIKLTYSPETKQTLLHWDSEVNINGNLMRVGQRVINSAAGMMSKNFFDAIDKQIPVPPAPVIEPSAAGLITKSVIEPNIPVPPPPVIEPSASLPGARLPDWLRRWIQTIRRNRVK